MKLPALSKTFNNKKVLELPSLDISEGKVTAVIGSNGSGKSTLAKILAGIEKPDIRVQFPKDGQIGYMPQKSIAFRMNLEKNILLNGNDKEKAARLMQSLGLSDVAKSRARRLSGGETAKMALARLLMKKYALLILDEPTASMDMESTLAAEKLIRKCADEGTAVLLITHSIRQAKRLADDVIFLSHGKLIEAGPASKVIESPEKEETKEFLNFYGA